MSRTRVSRRRSWLGTRLQFPGPGAASLLWSLQRLPSVAQEEATWLPETALDSV